MLRPSCAPSEPGGAQEPRGNAQSAKAFELELRFSRSTLKQNQALAYFEYPQPERAGLKAMSRVAASDGEEQAVGVAQALPQTGASAAERAEACSWRTASAAARLEVACI